MDIMDNYSDNELVSRASGGDTLAFETLFNRHYRATYRLAYRFIGFMEDAEDITQEVFIKVASNLHAFKGNASFKTWLYRITINTVRDYTRKSTTRTDKEQAYMIDSELLGRHDGPSIKEKVEYSTLYKALSTLPAEQREAIVLVYAEGLNHKEASAVLGCAETTISWRVFKARGKLKKLLNESEV